MADQETTDKTNKIDKNTKHDDENEYYLQSNKTIIFLKQIDTTQMILDQIININGYGNKQISLIITVICFKIFEGSQLLLFSNIFIPFMEYYEISNFATTFISSIMFFSFPVGSLLSSKLAKYFGRVQAFMACSISIVVLIILSAIIHNYIAFMIFRFLLGFLIGTANAIILGIYSEYLPIKLRSFFISVSVGCVLIGGGIYLNMVLAFFMPALQIEGLKNVLFALALMPIICIIICYYNLNDSPRHLLNSEQNEEAFEIIESMCEIKLSPEIKKRILTQQAEASHNKLEGMRSLFNDNYFKISTKLTLNWVINGFLLYGSFVIVSLVLRDISPEATNETILHKLFIISVISLPGQIAAGTLSEIKYFGRRNTIRLGFLIIAVSYLLGVIFYNHLEYFVGIGGFGYCLSWNINISFTCEIYPTKIRDAALGYFYSINRIAALFTHYIVAFLYYFGSLGPFAVCSLLSLLGFIITSNITIETHGKGLDSDFNAMKIEDNDFEDSLLPKEGKENNQD